MRMIMKRPSMRLLICWRWLCDLRINTGCEVWNCFSWKLGMRIAEIGGEHLIDCIYCPDCLMKGKKKILLYVDSVTSGIIFPYCKNCKSNIKIDLDKREENKRRGLIVPSGLSQVPANISSGDIDGFFI